MIPILTNATNTVGLVDAHNPKSDFIGEFNPLLLKQWADMVYDQFAGEGVVYLAIHKNIDPMVTTKCLSASAEHGDDIQVMVVGVDCDDVMKSGGRMSEEKKDRIVPLSVPVLEDKPLENDSGFHQRYCDNERERGHKP